MFSVIKISEQLRNKNFRAFELILTFVIKNCLLLPEAQSANAQRANAYEGGFTLDKIAFKLHSEIHLWECSRNLNKVELTSVDLFDND